MYNPLAAARLLTGRDSTKDDLLKADAGRLSPEFAAAKLECCGSPSLAITRIGVPECLRAGPFHPPGTDPSMFWTRPLGRVRSIGFRQDYGLSQTLGTGPLCWGPMGSVYPRPQGRARYVGVKADYFA